MRARKATRPEHSVPGLEQASIDNASMRDLNDLRVFEQVALLGNFSAAAKTLGMPKSTVSRSISRLEADLSTRLFQRTTRDVVLTPSGRALLDRCPSILDRVGEVEDYFHGLLAAPRGRIKVTAGIGFGVNVLAELIPKFLLLYPEVDVSLDLSSVHVDLVAAQLDVAIRLGPMADSAMIAKRIGSMPRYLCAAPGYLKQGAVPDHPSELSRHSVVEMQGINGRPRSWKLTRDGATETIELNPRVEANEALTIHRLVRNGVGIGCISGYVCAADLASGRLVHVLPSWSLSDVEVNVVFPSGKALSPLVRSFVDFLAANSGPGADWQARPC